MFVTINSMLFNPFQIEIAESSINIENPFDQFL